MAARYRTRILRGSSRLDAPTPSSCAGGSSGTGGEYWRFNWVSNVDRRHRGFVGNQNLEERSMAVLYIDGAVMNEAAPSTTGTITIPATVQRGDDLYLSITSSGHASGTALCGVTDDDTD